VKREAEEVGAASKKEAPLPGPKKENLQYLNLAVRLFTALLTTVLTAAAALLTTLARLLVRLLTLLVVLLAAALLLAALAGLLVLLIGHQLLLGFDVKGQRDTPPKRSDSDIATVSLGSNRVGRGTNQRIQRSDQRGIPIPFGLSKYTG